MKKEPSDGKEISFEEAYRQLEALVGSLESGQCELEDSLERYEKGIALLRICRQKLAGVSRRVELLKGIDEQGEPVLERLDETTLSSRNDVAGRQNSGTNATEPRVPLNVQNVGKVSPPSALPLNEQRPARFVEQQGRSARPEDETTQRRRAPIRRTRYDGSSSLFDVGGAPETRVEPAPTRGGAFLAPSDEPPF